MVEVKKVQNLFFSPTGSTKKVLEAISKGIGLPTTKAIDLTLPKQRETWSGTVDGDLIIVGVPVYRGTFPAVVLPYLKKLNGSGKLAVPIAVCGNVRMGTCLAEMSGILRKQDFTILAAGNFIGQHSFATDDYPLGIGRPDEDDLRKATEFGRQVGGKIKAGDLNDITSFHGGNCLIRLYVGGNPEAQGSGLPERWHPLIKVSVIEHGKEHCDKCNSCAESCPTGAINADSLQIDDVACVRCFACVPVCPLGLMQKVVSYDPELDSWFKVQEKYRGEPLVFL
jgi:ferredoxin/flavodoxin